MEKQFVFLEGAIKKHPTREINLEYIKKIAKVVVAIFDYKKENIYLLEKYRVASNNYELELFSLDIKENENLDEFTLKKLNENFSIKNDSIKIINKMPNYYYLSPGYTTEKNYFYEVILNENIESTSLLKINVNDAIKKINDLKSIFAINYFK